MPKKVFLYITMGQEGYAVLRVSPTRWNSYYRTDNYNCQLNHLADEDEQKKYVLDTKAGRSVCCTTRLGCMLLLVFNKSFLTLAEKFFQFGNSRFPFILIDAIFFSDTKLFFRGRIQHLSQNFSESHRKRKLIF